MTCRCYDTGSAPWAVASPAAPPLPAPLAPQMGNSSSHTRAACGSRRWRWPSLNTKDSACSTPAKCSGIGKHVGVF
eukprot:1157634-Pelagomonas_calceolata.AAC.5